MTNAPASGTLPARSIPGVAEARVSDGRITKQQRRGFIAAWLGWAFDGLDGYLYVLVALPFVTRLMAHHEFADEAARKAAVFQNASIIQGFFLVGWAIGGAVFGRLGDRLGRSRTLTLTILTYAIFTGLAFFATEWWHLLIFRFVAALGIGGEWAAGASLVSETIHPRHRAWVSATLQSGYMVGCIGACLTMWAFKNMDPKFVFLIGVVPALFVLWIRRAVPEPEEWAARAQAQTPPPVRELFRRGLAGTTIRTMTLTAIALTTVWAFLFFAPQIVRGLPEVQSWEKPRVDNLVTWVTIAYLLVNIGANFFGTYLARAVGYRRAFGVMLTGALATFLLGYDRPLSMSSVIPVFCLTAFFSLGLFGMFPLYIPPLFPTLLRTLGAGVCYNAGRLVSAAGAFMGGEIAATAGGPGAAVWWTGLLYIPAIGLAFFLDEGPHGRARRQQGRPEFG